MTPSGTGPAGTPPLAGLTVVSLEQAVAAPFATRQLADLGARVIKIERPGTGDFARGYDESVHGNSSYFVWLNRSKESLTLDVKQPEGKAILGDLLAKADVFVQNLGPGAAARLGTDATTLRQAYPDLITCMVSGWGTDGPWAHRKAYDLLIQCEAGLLSVTGTPQDMVRAGISVADIAAGMYAYSGILTALLLETPETADDPRFAANSARVEHRDELDELLGKKIAALPSARVAALLDEAGIANAKISDIPEFLAHPVLAERDRWRPVTVPGGAISALRPPADLDGIEPVMGPVPGVGEHTDAILRELDRDAETIARLRAGSVV
jgi:crotonobetainyl-CoA:carnitine CoA-transferase CaiB-like acyl-CoA transferase